MILCLLNALHLVLILLSVVAISNNRSTIILVMYESNDVFSFIYFVRVFEDVLFPIEGGIVTRCDGRQVLLLVLR